MADTTTAEGADADAAPIHADPDEIVTATPTCDQELAD